MIAYYNIMYVSVLCGYMVFDISLGKGILELNCFFKLGFKCTKINKLDRCAMFGYPLSYTYFGVQNGYVFFNLISNEGNFYILELKKIIQRSNTMSKCNDCKMFDSSRIRINMLIIEHLVYQKTMTSWSTFTWCWSLKIICNSYLGALVDF
jgi:hypothetical protein